jgi:hypothetical protein
MPSKRTLLLTNFLFKYIMYKNFWKEKMKNNVFLILSLVFLISSCSKTAGPSQPLWQTTPGATPTPSGREWQEMETKVPFTPKTGFSSIEFKGRVWLIGGVADNCKNDVWYSNNFETWSTSTPHAEFQTRKEHAVCVYDNKMWIIGGISCKENKILSDVWVSEDGLTFNAISENPPFGKRAGHNVFTFNEHLFLIAGYDGKEEKNDVWITKDGKKWEKHNVINPEAIYSPRKNAGLVVYKSKIWLIAGENKGQLLNDVWFSINGVDWEPATDNASFQPRKNASLTVFGGRMWIIGGKKDKDEKTDIWWSDDGKKWEEIKFKKFPENLSGFSIIPYRDRLWLLGGMADGKEFTNSIWSTK